MKMINSLHKYFTYSLLTIFTFSQTVAQSHWNLVDESNNSTLNKVIQTPNGNLITVGNEGVVLRSSNNGDTWSSLTFPSSENITNIKRHGNKIYALTEDGAIIESSNNGTSWTSQSVHSSALFDIDFQDGIGIVVGAQGFVYRTTNNGSTWQSAGQQSIFNLTGVLFVNDTLLLTVGSSGTSLKSIDNGITWSNIPSATSESFSSISYDPFRSQVVTVGTNGIQGIYGINSNSWSFSTLDNDWLKQRYCNDDNTCFTVGYNSTVLIFINSSSISVDMEQEENINSIFAINDSIAIAVTTSGKIYKTESGGFLVSASNIQTPTFTLYPNPAIDQIKIESQIEFQEYSIFSISGALVQHGLHNETINLNSLSKGLYILQMSNEKVLVQKTLIIR